MLCFKDMTFCASDCRNTACVRNWTPLKQQGARKWWGSDDAPVAFSDFSKTCEDYKP